MGAYRERLLKETYGNGGAPQPYGQRQEESGFLAMFKLRFTICLILFAGFAYLSLTGENISGVTAERIVEAVTEDGIHVALPESIQITEVNQQ